mmetsp:Transcript_1548/g.5084  ORF Transcript_1548/g.5084 Transcript_1548/m.5084 type:complete len:334 (-) Transcript_1548:1025-2026(-)
MVDEVDIFDWSSFDVFELEERTSGHSLRFVFRLLLERCGLVGLVDTVRLDSFLGELERLYSVGGNPYHTHLHAADVVATAATMLKVDAGLFSAFRDWELLSLAIACAGHDVGHQGVTNAYHASLKTDWYMMYASGKKGRESVNSINELAHVDITLSLLRQERHDFLHMMEAEKREKVLEYIEKMILRTDITWHEEVCERFVRASQKSSDAWVEEDRVQILSGLLHFADVSNPGRPWKLCKRWAELLHDETLLEWEKVAAHGASLSGTEAPCAEQPHAASLACSQIEFIKSTILPFCDQVSLVSPKFAELIRPHLDESVRAWALSQASIHEEES